MELPHVASRRIGQERRVCHSRLLALHHIVVCPGNESITRMVRAWQGGFRTVRLSQVPYTVVFLVCERFRRRIEVDS